MAKNNLDDVLRNLGNEETPPDIRRMAEETAGRLRHDLAQIKQREHPLWREYLMRNRIVQLAAVVAILAGVGVVSYHLGGSPGAAAVAWGEVLTQVQNAPTVTYKAYLTRNDPQGRQVVDESDVYVDQNQRCRIDSHMAGRPYMIRYLVPARKTFVVVQPQFKRYMQGTLSDIESAEMLEQQDPRQFCQQVLAEDYSKLGRSEIDGVAVEGIETKQENQIIRLWVDVKTNWPVRMEADGKVGQYQSAHFVLDHFQWDAQLDPGLFEPDIPADYTLSGPR
jgi:hypothetical protein